MLRGQESVGNGSTLIDRPRFVGVDDDVQPTTRRVDVLDRSSLFADVPYDPNYKKIPKDVRFYTRRRKDRPSFLFFLSFGRREDKKMDK